MALSSYFQVEKSYCRSKTCFLKRETVERKLDLSIFLFHFFMASFAFFPTCFLPLSFLDSTTRNKSLNDVRKGNNRERKKKEKRLDATWNIHFSEPTYHNEWYSINSCVRTFLFFLLCFLPTFFLVKWFHSYTSHHCSGLTEECQETTELVLVALSFRWQKIGS